MNQRPRMLILPIVAVVLATHCAAADKVFGHWPKGSSPTEIGNRVSEHLGAGPPTNFGRSLPPLYITYPEAVTWYGALIFAQASGNKSLGSRLIQRFEPLFGGDSNLVPQPDQVDRTVFAVVPLEIYIETTEPKYGDLGRAFADQQWQNAQPDGLTKQTRFWIDDMYMITAVQVQAYRATGDAKYLDRAALEMTTYLDKLQQPNGLFYHAPDAPFFWGAGRRLGSCRNGRTAAFASFKSSAACADPGRLP